MYPVIPRIMESAIDESGYCFYTEKTVFMISL